MKSFSKVNSKKTGKCKKKGLKTNTNTVLF